MASKAERICSLISASIFSTFRELEPLVISDFSSSTLLLRPAAFTDLSISSGISLLTISIFSRRAGGGVATFLLATPTISKPDDFRTSRSSFLAFSASSTNSLSNGSPLDNFASAFFKNSIFAFTSSGTFWLMLGSISSGHG
uniref:Uncharacterized protein n=1 Tax=Manihot esculenta TaxID=3983 RepID=A0A2C9WP94_MANES